MKLNLTFTMTVEMRKFSNGEDRKNDAGDNVDLDLTFNSVEAAMFLYKIANNIFEYQDYKVAIVTKHASGEISGISFMTEDYTYIVRAKTKFFADLVQGYEKIRFIERLSAITDIAEYALTVPEDDEVVDEFDEYV